MGQAIIANTDIRNYAKQKKVFLWEVAQVYGCNDSNFSRKLRKELSQKEKQVIRGIIKRIADGRKE